MRCHPRGMSQASTRWRPRCLKADTPAIGFPRICVTAAPSGQADPSMLQARNASPAFIVRAERNDSWVSLLRQRACSHRPHLGVSPGLDGQPLVMERVASIVLERHTRGSAAGHRLPPDEQDVHS